MNPIQREETTTEPQDRVTVGLTQAGFERLGALKDTEWFEQELDVYRLAISVALAQGIVAEPRDMKNVRTKYNVGSLDKDGRIKAMVGLFAPQAKDRPYAYAERLAEAGVKYLAGRIVAHDAMIADVLNVSEGTTADPSSL